jgi:mannosyltransferase OCH1-like enzyme
MLRRQLAVRIFALAALIYGLNCAFNQYAFQSFIDDLQIKFDDFPTEYVQALNSSVAHGQQPSEFDYTSAYPETKIPRTLHYIFFENLYPTHEGPKAVPLSGTRSPTLCRRHNPDYEIRIWNATSAREFFTKEYPWFLPTYDGYHYPIQRIDALKYFVLYHYGGVYLDLDVACRRSLDPLLAFPAWFPKASPLGVNNDLMASAARHPLLEKMTKGLVTHDWNLLFPYLTIFWTTGPRFTSDIIQEWYNNCDAEKCGKRSSNKDLGK